MSRLRDRKDKPPLPHQMRRHRLTDRDHQKDQAAEEKALRVQAAEFRADIGESVRTRHVIIGTLPCVRITSMNPDATMATDAISDMMRRMRCPAKSRRKVVRKDQLPYQGSPHNRVVCLEIPTREKLFYGKKENWDQITPSNSPRVRFTKQKNGRKGRSRGVIQKCEPYERSPCAPRFEEMSQDETSHQERCTRRLGVKCIQAQEYG